MVYQTLYNLAGQPGAAESTSFTDIEGKWYASAASWAEAEGLTSGVSAGVFGGERTMTRQELAKVFADYAVMQGRGRARGRPLRLHRRGPGGLLGGRRRGERRGPGHHLRSNNRLNPTGTAQRAELAQILMNFDALEPAYIETVVSIEVPEQDGIPAHTVPATVTIPTSASADAKVPGVVMLHGTGSNREEAGNGYAMAAPDLAMAGIATIRIDFMGNGDSTPAIPITTTPPLSLTPRQPPTIWPAWTLWTPTPWLSWAGARAAPTRFWLPRPTPIPLRPWSPGRVLWT